MKNNSDKASVMSKFYCKCLNVCVDISDSNAEPFKNQIKLTEEEKKDIFFQLPLFVSCICEVHLQQSALIKSRKMGSWIIYQCLNCDTYSYATENHENPAVTLTNKLLQEINDKDINHLRNSPNYSPVFKIVIFNSSSQENYAIHNILLSDILYTKILELNSVFSSNIEQKSRETEEAIRIFTVQQQNDLKNYIKHAKNDFNILKNVILHSDEFKIKDKDASEITHRNECSTDRVSTNSLITDNEKKMKNLSKDNEIEENEITDTESKQDSSIDIPPSFDSEGLFFLDGVEDNTLDDFYHSDDEQSDTDDSGNRDEGIHIPRRKSLTMAKSLPIKVPTSFDPSLQSFYERLDENKIKPDYKQKRNERPLDIAASIKALANSIHGDTIFGDLPPPRAGSKI